MSEKIDKNIEQILLENKLPECFIETYKTVMVVGLLLEPIKIGENMTNVAYQLNRLFMTYGISTAEFNDKLADLLVKYKQEAEKNTGDVTI